MYFHSRKATLTTLGVTSVVLSRTFFALLDDPEGPNLLIVGVMAVILYALSLAAYSYVFSVTGLKRLLLAVFTQVLIVIGSYFILK